MKKLISFILALVMMVTAVPAVLATAQDEAEKAFVIDGILDEWYRDDDWAVENECYFYYNGMDDTTLDVISRKPNSQDNGQMDMLDLFEDVKVKIYAAYDDRYAYFYVDVEDPHIATAYTDGNEYSQYIENIDFYVDTDLNSCDGDFFDNCDSYADADTHFRMIAHNKGIVDCKSQNKYIFEQETVIANEETGEPRYSAVGFFKHTDNTVPFHKFDDAGNLIGYGCETRVPLAYWYGETMYREIYYNIAVTNSPTTDDPTPCSVSTGKRWWLAYDTGKTIYFSPDEVNPFLGTVAITPEPDPTPTPSDALMLGDPNGDESVDAKDALITLRIAVNKFNATDDQKVACDVNKDGSINAKDALEMLKKAVGKPACF